jgi:hypothetical protein
MNALFTFILTAALCGLLVVGLVSVLHDLLRREVRFGETPAPLVVRRHNRYGIASIAPARNTALQAGSRFDDDRDLGTDTGGQPR